VQETENFENCRLLLNTRILRAVEFVGETWSTCRGDFPRQKQRCLEVPSRKLAVIFKRRWVLPPGWDSFSHSYANGGEGDSEYIIAANKIIKATSTSSATASSLAMYWLLRWIKSHTECGFQKETPLLQLRLVDSLSTVQDSETKWQSEINAVDQIL